MAGEWEVRGLFGNEYALESAVEEIRRLKVVPEFTIMDRRNLQVRLAKRDLETRELVKNIIRIAHGFVEADGPVGEYDRKRGEIKKKKAEEYEEKKREALQQQAETRKSRE